MPEAIVIYIYNVGSCFTACCLSTVENLREFKLLCPVAMNQVLDFQLSCEWFKFWSCIKFCFNDLYTIILLSIN